MESRAFLLTATKARAIRRTSYEEVLRYGERRNYCISELRTKKQTGILIKQRTMRKLFILLFILTPLIVYSQFEFPNDTNFKCYHLKNFKDFNIKPCIDNSMTFELRLWVSTFTELPVLLRLTLDNECIWKAEKYIVTENKTYEYKVIKSEVQLPANWDEIWDSLVASNILTFPDNPTFQHKRNAKDDEHSDLEVVITDGTSYTVDLLSKESSRQYSISNPIGYYSFYKDSKPLKDFNRILEILSEVFNYKFK